MAVAYITGKIETLGSIFSQETPKGATGVPATVKIHFSFYSRVFSKKRIKVTIELAFLFVSMLQ